MVIAKNMRRYIPSSEDFYYEEFPFYWLARVHGIYQREMERALAKVGTDIPTWRVLFILKVHGTSTVSEISTHAVAKLPTMTRIIQRMKQEGLVETNTHAEDGRVTEVSATDSGRALVQRIEEVTEGLFARSFKDFTPAQIARLNGSLAQLYGNLAGD
jgi:DNA-binding MarR family transcriptional regulator